jgi:hypothetical protein
MLQRHFLTIAVLSLATGAFAQDVANTGPASTASIPSFDPVVGQCETVATTPEIADPASGICVTATREFVASLSGLPAEAVQQQLADLVVALAVLPEGGAQCETFDDEIAEAIRIASTATTDPEQAAQFNEIAQTVVDQCGTGRTAAIDEALIPPIVTPTDDASDN